MFLENNKKSVLLSENNQHSQNMNFVNNAFFNKRSLHTPLKIALLKFPTNQSMNVPTSTIIFNHTVNIYFVTMHLLIAEN